MSDLVPDPECRYTASEKNVLEKQYEEISRYVAEHGPLTELWVQWPPYGSDPQADGDAS